jgi:hypothetical protein
VEILKVIRAPTMKASTIGLLFFFLLLLQTTNGSAEVNRTAVMEESMETNETFVNKTSAVRRGQASRSCLATVVCGTVSSGTARACINNRCTSRRGAASAQLRITSSAAVRCDFTGPSGLKYLSMTFSPNGNTWTWQTSQSHSSQSGTVRC